jgi:hypothetical protein
MVHTRVEAESNTSIVALRIVRGDKKGTHALEYNGATLFLRDINMGTWPSRLGESRIWESKIWLWVPRYSNLRVIALARVSSNCKRQGGYYRRTMTERIELKRDLLSWVSGVCRQDKLTIRKPSVVKLLWIWLNRERIKGIQRSTREYNWVVEFSSVGSLNSSSGVSSRRDDRVSDSDLRTAVTSCIKVQ